MAIPRAKAQIATEVASVCVCAHVLCVRVWVWDPFHAIV